MDREYALEEMLPSWSKVDQIKDLVIVDWSSKKPIIENKIVKEQMQKYNKIKIVRVENQKYLLSYRITRNEFRQKTIGKSW
jgi:hypothetical protein